MARRDERTSDLRKAIFGGQARAPGARLPASVPDREPTLDGNEILASIEEVPYQWDIATDALTWGMNAPKVLGLEDPAAAGSGRRYAQLLSPDTVITPFDAVVNSPHRDEGRGVAYQFEYALRVRPDATLWIEDTGRWFAGPEGRPARAHGVVRVVTDRHAEQERLSYLSKFDALTGEINRNQLIEVLAAGVDDAVRSRASCAFLVAAIDNLSHLNESYGYEIADEAIAAVAKRLRAQLRAGDIIGRLSGNKFGIVLRNCTGDEMTVAAERLLEGLRDEPIQTSATPVALTATIGGVIAPRHARNLSETLARAQEAMDAAKAKRPGSFLAYRPSIERDAIRRENLRATDEIVTALNERQILLAFEPVVDARSREPLFHEALMRFRRADGTVASADTIIPLAERLGLVRLLDHRVLELVVAELVSFPHISLSVNVSPASTVDPDWWDSLAAQLKAHPGVGERLMVEITEMAAIHDVDETRGFVSRVKDLGCRIAMDDFGAGFTSFRNLRKLGVDVVKIDGSFVQDLARSRDDQIFVRTLTELGRSLGLITVAEWVQSVGIATQLAAWGCDCLQGDLVGRATTEPPWAAGRKDDVAAQAKVG